MPVIWTAEDPAYGVARPRWPEQVMTTILFTAGFTKMQWGDWLQVMVDCHLYPYLIGPWEIHWNFRSLIIKLIVKWLITEVFLWNFPQVIVIGLHWLLVNIGSGNGWVPSGNKPLPEPMLTKIFCHRMAWLGHNEDYLIDMCWCNDKGTCTDSM